MPNEPWISGALDALGAGAKIRSKPDDAPRRPKSGRASSTAASSEAARALPDPGGQIQADDHSNFAAGKPTGRATSRSTPKSPTRALPDPGGQEDDETPLGVAAGNPTGRAIIVEAPMRSPRAHPDPGGLSMSANLARRAAGKPLERARPESSPTGVTPARPAPGGQDDCAAHSQPAAGKPTGRANQETAPTSLSRAHPDPGGQANRTTQSATAAGNPTGRARDSLLPNAHTRAHPDPGGLRCSDTQATSAAGKPTGRAIMAVATKAVPCAHPDPGGQVTLDAPSGTAAGNPTGRANKEPAPIIAARAHSDPGGHSVHDAQNERAAGNLLLRLVEQWRRRQDMVRARISLELQAQAICRRLSHDDKAKAGKLWAAIRADPAHPLRGWLNPFLVAMEPLAAAQKELDRTVETLARELPTYAWAKAIPGLGDLSFGGLVAETRIGPGAYRSPAALWKRMGLAVIDGQRQRRVTGKAALEQGFAPPRAALMWNIGNNIIKAQLRNEKDEAGKRIDGSSHAIGALGQVYLDRKAYQNDRNAERETPWPPLHIHNDSRRYMEKRLLLQAWRAWRRASDVSEDQSPYARRPLPPEEEAANV